MLHGLFGADKGFVITSQRLQLNTPVEQPVAINPKRESSLPCSNDRQWPSSVGGIAPDTTRSSNVCGMVGRKNRAASTKVTTTATSNATSIIER
jgi:hypothetical protein